MRAVVWFGLAVAVFAVVCVHDTEAISFDELVARVSAPPKPKAKPVVKRVDPEMAEWSTEHLLGLDAPPPAHMFDSLLKPKKAKAVHKTVHKAHHAKKVVKHHHHVAKKVHRVAKKKAVKHATHVEAHQLAENLLDSMPTEHHSHRVHHSKKVHHKKHHKVHHKTHHKKHTVPKEEVQMVTTHISDLVTPTTRSHHKKVHHKVHHKKVHHKKVHHKKQPSILAGLNLPKADDVVPEEDMKEDRDAFTHGLVHPTNHKKHHPKGLQGFAAAALKRADAQKEEQESVKQRRAKKLAKKAKKAAEDQDAIEKDEAKKIGGHVVHLDLSQDAVDPLQEDDDDLPSLDSFMEDDDDDY